MVLMSRNSEEPGCWRTVVKFRRVRPCSLRGGQRYKQLQCARSDLSTVMSKHSICRSLGVFLLLSHVANLYFRKNEIKLLLLVLLTSDFAHGGLLY